MMTDDLFTQPPWSSDVAGIIYAVNGRAGQTTVATLRRGASAELLAAAPDLLYAVEGSIERLARELTGPPANARDLAAVETKNFAETAIARARRGYPDSTERQYLWTINPELPPLEGEANACLLAAAEDLWEAAKRAYAALSHDAENGEVVGSIRYAMVRSGRVTRR